MCGLAFAVSSLVIFARSANAEDWTGDYQSIGTPNGYTSGEWCQVSASSDYVYVGCNSAGNKIIHFNPGRLQGVKKGDIIGFVWNDNPPNGSTTPYYRVTFTGYSSVDATLLKNTYTAAWYRANIDNPVISNLFVIGNTQSVHVSAYRIRYKKEKSFAQVQKERENEAKSDFQDNKKALDSQTDSANQGAKSSSNSLDSSIKTLMSASPQSPSIAGEFRGLPLSFDFTQIPPAPPWLVTLESIPLAYISFRCFARLLKTIPELTQAWRNHTMNLSMCFDFLGV